MATALGSGKTNRTERAVLNEGEPVNAQHSSLRHRIRRAVVGVGDRLAVRLLTPAALKRLAVVPSLPKWFRRRYAAAHGAWEPFDRPIPAELLTVPGIQRDVDEENSAYADAPLLSFHHRYGASVVWSLGRLWESVIPVGPRLMRAIARAQGTARSEAPAAPAAIRDPDELTNDLRVRSGEIGLSAVGVAAYDPRYTFADHAHEIVGETVIICILEQNWSATQTLPGPLGEQTALSTNAEVIEMVTDLTLWLQGQGYSARAHTTEGAAAVHHYAVESGLGQLGYNGQLLTPQAGSRCRIAMISTTAPLRPDAPRDYGIPAICGACRACVRRCPAGAIPSKPVMYRGVLKSKLNLDRCFPLVSQANGCSVCIKVCPVQRYGLGAVLDHYETNDGEILGTGTDELEGFDWPLDGRHYSPGDRPYLNPSFYDVPGFGALAVPEHERALTENPLM